MKYFLLGVVYYLGSTKTAYPKLPFNKIKVNYYILKI